MSGLMVGQIARAIYEQRNGYGCRPWSQIGREHQRPYLMDAKSALLALREPTPSMMHASGDGPNTSRRVFRSMIDVALEETADA